MATVATQLLVTSAVLSSVSAFAIWWGAILAILITTSSTAGQTFGAGTLVLSVIGLGRNIWHRVATQYGFSVSLAPDGIRIQRGLLSTVHETVPFARVQAVRKIEPLWWRLFGWCRLEVDVAGSPGDEPGGRSSRVTKALLPVGRYGVADALFSSLLGLHQFPLTKPPRRAFWKSPLSYHFLAAGTDGNVVASSMGRLRKVTVWVPLEKVQSVRRAQGPWQRAFHLASVHVDAAGRRARAELRDRDLAEAGTLFEKLVLDSRAARRRPTSSPARTPAVVAPAPTLQPWGAPAGPVVPSPPSTSAPWSLPDLPPPTGPPISGLPSPEEPPPEGTTGAGGGPPLPGQAVDHHPEPGEPRATGQPLPPPPSADGRPGHGGG
jgi:putative membrane protein